MDNKRVILALRTNVNQERNVKQVMRLSADTWSDMKLTTPRWTQPTGMASGLFYNCLTYTKAGGTLEDFVEKMKNIERICGDTRAERSLDHIQMGTDILLHGDNKLYIDDRQHDCVQELMREIEVIKH